MQPFCILLAVDFSQASTAALEYTRELVRRMPCTVTIVHAYSPGIRAPTLAATTSPDAIVPFLEAEGDMLLADVQELTAAWAEPLRKAGATVDVVAVEGRADTVVLEVAAQLRPGMVVMGRQGMGAVRRILVGSVTRYVVEHSDRPVAVVPFRA